MTSLPTGTVAFLMSDIEGSTRLIGVAGLSVDEAVAMALEVVTHTNG
jgi:hypothetical protein